MLVKVVKQIPCLSFEVNLHWIEALLCGGPPFYQRTELTLRVP